MAQALEMHPHTTTEAVSAARTLEGQGVEAMNASGDQRANLVSQMQSELQKMSPEERARVYANYQDANASSHTSMMIEGQMSWPRSTSQPYGTVEKGADGQPSGLTFHAAGMTNAFKSIFGGTQDEIQIRPQS